MTLEWLAIIMFVLFLLHLLLIGYPVAFSFAATVIVFGGIGLMLGIFPIQNFNLQFNRWFGDGVSSFVLLAVPFFVFMGAVFEKSGLAERLITTVGLLMGPLKGGLALAVVVVGALLGATGPPWLRPCRTPPVMLTSSCSNFIRAPRP